MTCTKAKYASRHEAKGAVKRLNMLKGFDLTDVYECPVCGCDVWHTTSMNKKQSRNLTRKRK